ncbi:MAG: hypothetical protein M0C28_22580 [Candidatus Moduliflexus flocculans]|nr:hypothetical protein [Candidatus Moduliflexus flocculans]
MENTYRHTVHRHLISAKVSLEFEPHLGKFTVRPAIDNDYVDAGTDMLDIEEQPQNSRSLIEDGRKTLQENLWERATLDPILTAIANSLADSDKVNMMVPRLNLKIYLQVQNSRGICTSNNSP